ncbi:hypothetical protein FA15DRAFT_663230 [Coprinopsis marcescibilis]|uniref:Uncharacterized protein n=1 Tax=Coprinopsis marcescibilis TaxID=230819 RepID=A0A5C3LA65_COPMA|nr:hypothetical protein FA15DRAFT_663230 [Coprinopsis marcescibilis]
MAIERFLGTRAQKGFLFTIIIQAIIVLVMIGVVFGMVEDRARIDLSPKYKTLPCYLGLFMLAEIFQTYMAFDGLRSRNIIQLFGLLWFHLAMMIFAAVQIDQTRVAIVWFSAEQCAEQFSPIHCDGPGTLNAAIKPFLIVVPCIIGASLPILAWFFKELYSEFGWAIFHVVGANPKMKTMYQYYQIMICLLKFDFLFFTGVTMQLIILVLQTQSAEFGVTIAAIPVVLALLVLCGFALQREIKVIMTISLILMLAAQSYLYKLVRFYQPENAAVYATTRVSLTIFTIIAFLLLFATFVIGLRCFSDFDQGLQASKTSVIAPRQQQPPKGDDKEKGSGLESGVLLAPRLSIE